MKKTLKRCAGNEDLCVKTCKSWKKGMFTDTNYFFHKVCTKYLFDDFPKYKTQFDIK